jgi:hypothetical protein
MCYPGQLLIATEINSPDVQCVCMCVCVCVCMCTYSHMYQCNPVFGWLGWVLLHLIPVSSSTRALKLHVGNAGIGQRSPRPPFHVVSAPLDPPFHRVRNLPRDLSFISMFLPWEQLYAHLLPGMEQQHWACLALSKSMASFLARPLISSVLCLLPSESRGSKLNHTSDLQRRLKAYTSSELLGFL